MFLEATYLFKPWNILKVTECGHLAAKQIYKSGFPNGDISWNTKQAVWVEEV